MEKVLVLDFGGQYNQLIAKVVRENNIYSEIKSYDKITVEEIKKENYKGIILTGGPHSVYEEGSPSFDPELFHLNIPILGICYGFQLMTYLNGGVVSPASTSEYGRTEVELLDNNPLLKGLKGRNICWMSHTDSAKKLPDGFINIAHTDLTGIAGIANIKKKLYGVQFHPEVKHTAFGDQLFKNFLFDICGCKGDWIVTDFVNDSIEKYKKELAGQKVVLGLSGGVDSLVAAVILNKAIGKNLLCIFVDHGLLRKNEGDIVENVFQHQFSLNVKRINAQDRFLAKLSGVTEPEKKRKIIGAEFVKVFEEEAMKSGFNECLAQGTIYPDVVESGNGKSAVIKSHHNVGGLPKDMLFKKVVEPLRYLFKDEVRKIGLSLGIPYDLVYRQPFPGPGLAIRIIGEITKEKIEILQDADAIFREEVKKNKLEDVCCQYFAVNTGIKAVGVKGDGRTYGYVIALRSVNTTDFMTASWSKVPLDFLEMVSNRITNEVKGVARVVYDITSKPPGTVEWE